MARPTGEAAARAVDRAAARLEQIHREMAAILRKFPDLQGTRNSRLIVWGRRLRSRPPVHSTAYRTVH